MKEGSSQLLKKAHTALAAAKRDIEAEAPDQVIARTYYAAFHAVTAVLHEQNITCSNAYRYPAQILQDVYRARYS